MDRGASRATVHAATERWTQLSNSTKTLGKKGDIFSLLLLRTAFCLKEEIRQMKKETEVISLSLKRNIKKDGKI